MNNKKTLKTIYKFLLCLFPFVLTGIIVLFAHFVAPNFTGFPDWMPGCLLYDTSRLFYEPGITCPACGGTRSVIALLKGDILMSLRQNAMVIPFGIYFVLLYFEYTLSVFGVKVKRIFMNYWVISSICIIAIIYSIIRNLVPAIAPVPI